MDTAPYRLPSSCPLIPPESGCHAFPPSGVVLATTVAPSPWRAKDEGGRGRGKGEGLPGCPEHLVRKDSSTSTSRGCPQRPGDRAGIAFHNERWVFRAARRTTPPHSSPRGETLDATSRSGGSKRGSTAIAFTNILSDNMLPDNTVVIIVEAGLTLGMKHLYRCSAPCAKSSMG